jgi:ABC-type molybdate transport system permease subunit
MHAMFAQSLGEYGALGSLASGVQQLTYSISTGLGSLSATTWIIAAIVVLGLVILRRR